MIYRDDVWEECEGFVAWYDILTMRIQEEIHAKEITTYL